MKCSAFVPEVLLDPKVTNSGKANEAALSRAFGTDLDAFPWFELPENAYRLRRFGMAMRIGQQLFLPPQNHKGP